MTHFKIYFGEFGKQPILSITVLAGSAYCAYDSLWGIFKDRVLYITSKYNGEEDGGTFLTKYQLDNPQIETYEYPF